MEDGVISVGFSNGSGSKGGMVWGGYFFCCGGHPFGRSKGLVFQQE